MRNPHSVNMGMIQNAPIAFSIDDIPKDLHLQSLMSTCLPLKVNDLLTRTVKLQFGSSSEYIQPQNMVYL